MVRRAPTLETSTDIPRAHVRSDTSPCPRTSNPRFGGPGICHRVIRFTSRRLAPHGGSTPSLVAALRGSEVPMTPGVLSSRLALDVSCRLAMRGSCRAGSPAMRDQGLRAGPGGTRPLPRTATRSCCRRPRSHQTSRLRLQRSTHLEVFSP